MDLDSFEQAFNDISGPCMDCKKINPFASGCCSGCVTWDKIMALVMKNHLERQMEKMKNV